MRKQCGIIVIMMLLGELAVAEDTLKKYRSKRNVKESGEPAGKIKAKNKLPIFTIQKHNASRLHYDFRIEVNGVMPSWAVPKGPSLDPKVKRLAVMTEDHPVDYATFEGVIPPGNYGAGQVIVWDFGTYENIKHDHDGNLMSMQECLKRGTVEIKLQGKKLHGAFALVRTHLDDGKDWLLIKMKDEHMSTKDIVKTSPKSVLSGTTIEDLQNERLKKQEIKAKASKAKKPKKIETKKDSKKKINGQNIQITHPEKILFPKSDINKQTFVDYYQHIAPFMVPHLKNRPITMQRFVDGIHEEGFYQKEAGSYFPDWIERVAIKKEGGVVNYTVINDAKSLVYLANQLVITFHRGLSTTSNLDCPNVMIFDLDPAEKSMKDTFNQVRQAALMLKKILEKLGLVPYVMTTGSKGLHIVTPIKQDSSFDVVKEFAYDIARIMVNGMPDMFTVEMRKDKREGKIFVDWLRNGFSATAVCPYSVRPKEGAPIAVPLEWAEVSKKSLRPDQFTIKNIGARLKRKGEIWKDMQKNAKSITAARKKLQTIKNMSVDN